MKTIEEYTDYLLSCSFADDNFDPEGHEDHLKMSWEMLDNYAWDDIYPVWIQYLHTKCKTPDDVINFANLYFYYDLADRKIPDPLDFISYLYFRVDMDAYWDKAGELFDSLANSILSNHGLVNAMDNPYYDPLKDERILSRVASLKNNPQ